MLALLFTLSCSYAHRLVLTLLALLLACDISLLPPKLFETVYLRARPEALDATLWRAETCSKLYFRGLIPEIVVSCDAKTPRIAYGGRPDNRISFYEPCFPSRLSFPGEPHPRLWLGRFSSIASAFPAENYIGHAISASDQRSEAKISPWFPTKL